MLRKELRDVLKIVEWELELRDAINKAQLPSQVKHVTLKVLIDPEGIPRVVFAYPSRGIKPSNLRSLAESLGVQVWVLEFRNNITAINVESGDSIPLLREELDAFVELTF